MKLDAIQQSYIWAKFREEAKNELFWKLIVGEKEVFLQKMPLPLGKCWLYCNRGPETEDYEGFLAQTNEIAKENKAVFLRIEPGLEENNENYYELCEKLGFRDAHASYQPSTTTYIDLSLELDEILKKMKPKGRYNIKLAEKKGVVVNESNDVGEFYKILEETLERDNFHGHNKDYYQKMIDILGEKSAVKLYTATYEGETIAGIIVTFYGNTATYYYGASSNKHRNVMAPYLLQWHAIQEAKKRGHKYYDFLGIAPEGVKNHPWQGVTQFKMKFGGNVLNYVKAKEKIYSPFWYRMIRLIKKIKGR